MPGTRTIRLVHGDVGQPRENLGAAVGRWLAVEQVRTLVDERGAEVSAGEGFVGKNCLQEADVG